MRIFPTLTALAVLMCLSPAAEARVMVACPMDAKICPDGSAVARTGPNCEFAPCPGETPPPGQTNPPPETRIDDSMPGQEGSSEPGYPGPDNFGGGYDGMEGSGTVEASPGFTVEPTYTKPDPVEWPDKPLKSVPKGAISVEYLFEHRSALLNQTVTVKGVVETTLLKDKACPPNMGMCAQPRITLRAKDLKQPYKVTILLKEDNNEDYRPGDTAAVRAELTGSGAGTLVMQER